MTEKQVKAMEVTTMEFGAGANPFSFMSSDSWCLVDQNADKTVQNQVTVCNDGEFDPDSVKAYGEKIDISANYEAKVNLEISMGSIQVGAEGVIAIDGISISTKQGAKATASVKAHKHGSGKHMARVRNVVIPAFYGWGAQLFEQDIGIGEECIQSGTYDISFGHVDQPNNSGEHLIGIVRQETHTMKFDYVSDTAPEGIEGWIMTNSPHEPTKSRDGFVSGSVTYVKYIGTPTTP